jgi:hypothetical protein
VPDFCCVYLLDVCHVVNSAARERR